VSDTDITPDAVVAAVQAGHDDALKLAEHFQVLPVSHTLRSTIAGLIGAQRLMPCESVDQWYSVPRLEVA